MRHLRCHGEAAGAGHVLLRARRGDVPGDPRQRAGSHSAVHGAQRFRLVPGGRRGRHPGLTATDVETDCEVVSGDGLPDRAAVA